MSSVKENGAPQVALLARYGPALQEALALRFRLHQLPPGVPLDSLSAEQRASIQAIVTVGGRGLLPFTFDDFPALELVAITGAGYDKVDVDDARRRGIEVAYGPGANAACVADHALALLLAAARGIVRARDGTRPDHLFQLQGKRVGIIGLGNIGKLVARRLAGFDAEVFYHGRREQEGVGYRYFADPVALAEAADYLVVCCPGGAATKHLVNAEMLRALGPRGLLVNVGRGGVVDTQALAAALRGGVIGGAALDVIEGEPDVDPALRALPGLVLTPHVASQSPESQAAVLAMLLQNLDGFFGTGKVVYPAPAT